MRAVFGYGFIVKDKKYDLDNHLGTLCTVVPLIDGTELVCVSDSMAITGRGSARNGEARANYWFNGITDQIAAHLHPAGSGAAFMEDAIHDMRHPAEVDGDVELLPRGNGDLSVELDENGLALLERIGLVLLRQGSSAHAILQERAVDVERVFAGNLQLDSHVAEQLFAKLRRRCLQPDADVVDSQSLIPGQHAGGSDQVRDGLSGLFEAVAAEQPEQPAAFREPVSIAAVGVVEDRGASFCDWWESIHSSVMHGCALSEASIASAATIAAGAECNTKSEA